MQTMPSPIVKAFFDDAIRSAIIVDDDFRNYTQLLGDPVKDFSESSIRQLQKDLYDYLSQNHYICDIEGDIEKIETQRIHKSDLVILDYHLNGESAGEEHCHKILAELANSAHFNLVVVYTKDPDLSSRFFETLINLVDSPKKDYSEDDQDEYFGLTADTKKELVEILSAETCINCLKNGVRSLTKSKDLPQQILDKSKSKSKLLEQALSERIEVLQKNSIFSNRLSVDALNYNFADDDTPWFHLKNLFVVFVHKKQGPPQGNELLGKLKKALISWNPNPLQIALSALQNAISAKAPASINYTFNDRELQAGLALFLLQNWSGEVNELVSESATELIEMLAGHAFGQLIREESFQLQLNRIIQQGIDGVVPQSNSDKLQWIADKFNCGKPEIDKILHEFNRFISNEQIGIHLKPGSIFLNPASPDDVFLCATPACDLIPGQKIKGDKLPFIAIKLNKVNKATAIKGASDNKAVFFTDQDGTQLTFEIKKGEKIQSHSFVATNQGNFVNKVLQATFFDTEDQKVSEYKIVAQLKPIYANRIIQELGAYQTRIGLDYLGNKTIS